MPLAVSSANWKDHAAHTTFDAEDLGAKVRLHPQLTADAYACPGCGSLLEIEIRWQQDEPLQSLQFPA